MSGPLDSVVAHVTRTVATGDPLRPGDAIVVLNGKVGVRAARAAEVFHAGIAPHILLVDTRDAVWKPYSTVQLFPATSQRMAAEMERHGVPSSVIRILPGQPRATDTRAEAKALREYATSHPLRRIVVVTTDYHIGRARLVLQQELRGTGITVVMVAAPDDTGINPSNWWRSWRGLRTYATEYTKLLLQAASLR